MKEIDLTPDCGDDFSGRASAGNIEPSLEVRLLRQVLAGQDDLGQKIDSIIAENEKMKLQLAYFEIRQERENNKFNKFDDRIRSLEEWREEVEKAAGE